MKYTTPLRKGWVIAAVFLSLLAFYFHLHAVATENLTAQTTEDACGNGVINKGEQCDRGRYNGVSECSTICTLNFCGDGIVDATFEECEPKRGNNGKYIKEQCGRTCKQPMCGETGCTVGCKWQFLQSCSFSSSSFSLSASADAPSALSSEKETSASSFQASSPSPAVSSFSSLVSIGTAASCGNGQRERGELCDDGNTIDGDGCSSICITELVLSICGNGAEEEGEQCDEGALNTNTKPDGCRRNCAIAHCGDGVKDKGEDCDDGNIILGDGCTTSCLRALCGNGILERGEECDAGERNVDDTPNACSRFCLMPRCGDARVDTLFGEECDEGELNSDKNPDRCRNMCIAPSCGDSVKDTGEECDDGNALSGDECLPTCRLPVCGNGQVEGAEECDGDTKGISCSADCTVQHAAAPSPEASPSAAPWVAALASLPVIGLLSLILVRKMRMKNTAE